MMTASTRSQVHGAFKKALKLLSDTHHGRNEHICTCLQDLEHAGKISTAAMLAARKIVMERLNGSYTLSSWLRMHGGVPEEDVSDDREYNAGRRAQAARKAWLESLVQEFSA